VEEDALGIECPDADDRVDGGSSEEWCDEGLRLPFREEDRCISGVKLSGGVST
jgi:coproporphyrinogen III oxidase